MDVIWDPASEIVRLARLNMVPKLSKDYNERDDHPEYRDQMNSDKHFAEIENLILEHDLKDHSEFYSQIVPSLFILYKQRISNSFWNTTKYKQRAEKLNTIFKKKHFIDIDCVLVKDLFKTQEVFDGILRELNKNLTSVDLKKYPAIIDVYCELMGSLQEYEVYLNPAAVFPISLLLMDDYIVSNKVRGLKCCLILLKSMNEKHFENGNYYDVVFSSLTKAISEKDLDVSELVLECILQFIQVIPEDVKKLKRDETLTLMLEQLHLETNLYRKRIYFNKLQTIIDIHQTDCGSNKMLKTVLFDGVNECCTDAVADILLADVLECLRSWIKYCWCVWRLSSDHKFLTLLIKLLYVSRKESEASDIAIIIKTLISLCSMEERMSIHENLQKSKIDSPEFNQHLEEIKSCIEL